MSLDVQVRALLRRARDLYRDDPEVSGRLDRHLARMTDPLLVAVAGKVKAGKSTLIDALAGEVLFAMIETSDPGSAAEADAVIYLTRHVHAIDLTSLEAFHDNAMNSVAVLARADEIGAGRLDAMTSARRIARRYAADERLRGLCQAVVPVAGLLARTAHSLRQSEFEALSKFAGMPREHVDSRLLSADRLLGVHAQAGALLERLGMFGVRLSVTLIRQGFDTPSRLAEELVRRSGFTELLDVLTVHFDARTHLLKARSGLTALEKILRQAPRPDSIPLVAEVERLLAGAHEFAEARLLDSLRSGSLLLPDGVLAEAERLLGAHGAAVDVRLGLRDASRPDQRAAVLVTLDDWQRRAENPLSSRQCVRAARVIVRTCEGLLAELPR